MNFYENTWDYKALTITYSNGTQSFSKQFITGNDIRSWAGLTNDSEGNAPSVFVNFDFAPNETSNAFYFRSSNAAFEWDNIAFANKPPLSQSNRSTAGRTSTNVSEPMVLGLLGGAVLLVAARRKGVR